MEYLKSFCQECLASSTSKHSYLPLSLQRPDNVAHEMASERLADVLAFIEHSSLVAYEKDLYSSACHSIFDTAITCTASSLSNLSLLASVALPREPSHVPLACLSFLLAISSGPWPTFDIIRLHSRFWRILPEGTKSCQDLKYSKLTETSIRQVKSSYQSLRDLLVPSEKAAIIDAQSQAYVSHNALLKFIHDFDLPILGEADDKKPIIVLALPNGPLMGLACMAVATYFTVAPISSQSGVEQFRADIEQTHAKVAMVLRSDVSRLGLEGSWIKDAGIQVLIVEPRPDMTFNVIPLNTLNCSAKYHKTANCPNDVSFILFTSGTSGAKKAVPLPLHNVVSGVAFVIDSWDLKDNDICLNMMPLNHMYINFYFIMSEKCQLTII